MGGGATARSRATSRFRRITIEQGGEVDWEEGGGLSAVFIDTFTMAMTSCTFGLGEPIYTNAPASNRLASISAPLPCPLRFLRLLPRFNQLSSSSDSLRLLASYSSSSFFLVHRPREKAVPAASQTTPAVAALPPNCHRATPQKDVTTHDRGEYSVKSAGLGIAIRSSLFCAPHRSIELPATLPLHQLSSIPTTLPLPAALVNCPPLVLGNCTPPCSVTLPVTPVF
jgi:hypothetical protein